MDLGEIVAMAHGFRGLPPQVKCPNEIWEKIFAAHSMSTFVKLFVSFSFEPSIRFGKISHQQININL